MNQTAHNPVPTFLRRRAFTLIELLVVISLSAALAALTIGGLRSIGTSKKIGTAQAELNEIGLAIENYHAKYGVYPPGNAGNTDSGGLTNQLYYELTGVSINSQGNYQTVGTNSVSPANFSTAFGVGGILNATKGSGEDALTSQNFLVGLRPNRVGTANINGVAVNMLVTSVAGPDPAYLPIGTPGVNPFRYKAPNATNNNPGSYDLWIELSLGATNYNSTYNGNNQRLIANWSKNTIKNSTMP